MHIVHVYIHVKPEFLEKFIQATFENARNSILEPGVARFDVIQQVDDPTRITLLEVYRTPEDHLKHRETAHYARWRDTVTDWMVEPRVGVKHKNLFPDDQGWG